MVIKRGASPRLEAALALVVPGAPLWDLCCDHGYLGVQAAARGLSAPVHFCDSALEGMRRLYQRINRSPAPFTLEFHVDVCGVDCYGHTCAAEKLPVEAISGTVAILGVGTSTVISILERWIELKFSIEQIDRLILGTHTQTGRLEQFLEEQRWVISGRMHITEGRRTRELWTVGRLDG